MGIKLKFLKKSFIRKKSLDVLYNLFSACNVFSKKITPQKGQRVVLISTLDALGDNVTKMESINKIIEHFGIENVYILCRKHWCFLFENLGVKLFIDDTKGNAIKRALLYIDVDKINYTDIVFFESAGDSTTEDIIDKKGKKTYGVLRVEEKWLEDLKKGEKHILEFPKRILKELTGESYTLEELRGNEDTFSHIKEESKEYKIKDEKYIVFGIGASNVIKTMPIECAVKILIYLAKRYSNTKILLLGSGKRQTNYVKKLLNVLEETERDKLEGQVVNLVGKTSVKEGFFLIKNSYFFIGYDSGLGNVAFSLNKKLVSLLWQNHKLWDHSAFSNVAIVKGDGTNPFYDGVHGTDILIVLERKILRMHLKS